MKYLLNKQSREEFLAHNYEFEEIYFKWTTSHNRDTYGYNICTLRDKRGNKINSNCGGGYDMKGTAFGEFITEYFNDELKRLTANYGSGDNGGGYYGLVHYNNKTHKRQKRASKNTTTYLDGGCGFSCMQSVFNKIGFKLTFVSEMKSKIEYKLNVK